MVSGGSFSGKSAPADCVAPNSTDRMISSRQWAVSMNEVIVSYYPVLFLVPDGSI